MVGVAAAVGAGCSTNPVGVDGSGGVCKLLSMGFEVAWGWEGVEGDGFAGLVTGGESWDWLMSPHWISASTGSAEEVCWHAAGKALELKLKGFRYGWELVLGGAVEEPDGWLMCSEPCIIIARQQWCALWSVRWK